MEWSQGTIMTFCVKQGHFYDSWAQLQPCTITARTQLQPLMWGAAQLTLGQLRLQCTCTLPPDCGLDLHKGYWVAQLSVLSMEALQLL